MKKEYKTNLILHINTKLTKLYNSVGMVYDNYLLKR